MITLIIIIILFKILFFTSKKKSIILKESYKNSYYKNIRDTISDNNLNNTNTDKNKICEFNGTKDVKPIIYTKGFNIINNQKNLLEFDNLVSSQKYYETGNNKWN